ncbi:MAG: glycine-rich domain-containing protein-like [Cyanobacteria bacterium P01_C01_bin.38]
MRIVTFWDKLNNLSLEMVGYKLMSSKGWTPEKTQVAINRYKLFLYLKSVYPATALVPTLEIDAVWHAHFEVNLQQYINDTNYLFGYTLNHTSNVNETEEMRQIYGQAFNKTTALFEQIFGIGVLDTSLQIAGCADIPIDTNPAPCADLPIVPNCAGSW